MRGSRRARAGAGGLKQEGESVCLAVITATSFAFQRKADLYLAPAVYHVRSPTNSGRLRIMSLCTLKSRGSGDGECFAQIVAGGPATFRMPWAWPYSFLQAYVPAAPLLSPLAYSLPLEWDKRRVSCIFLCSSFIPPGSPSLIHSGLLPHPGLTLWEPPAQIW